MHRYEINANCNIHASYEQILQVVMPALRGHLDIESDNQIPAPNLEQSSKAAALAKVGDDGVYDVQKIPSHSRPF